MYYPTSSHQRYSDLLLTRADAEYAAQALHEMDPGHGYSVVSWTRGNPGYDGAVLQHDLAYTRLNIKQLGEVIESVNPVMLRAICYHRPLVTVEDTMRDEPLEHTQFSTIIDRMIIRN